MFKFLEGLYFSAKEFFFGGLSGYCNIDDWEMDEEDE